jgi:hypothetical protein
MTQSTSQELYPVVVVTSKSLLGDSEKQISFKEALIRFKTLPVVMAFLQDDEIQEMTVCSANSGFVKTFRKYSASNM